MGANGNKLDLAGKTFGNLYVIGFAGMNKHNASLWECRCELCGKTTEIMGSLIKQGKRTSCGCENRKKELNLTGKTFGRWTVVEFAGYGEHGNCKWHCMCGCPKKTERDVNEYNLVSGKTMSCGCVVKENQIAYLKEKFIGTTFGMLTVVGLSKRNKNGHLVWDCKCSCGNSVDVFGTNLIRGHTVSCGCESHKIAGEKIRLDLLGRQFGRWTVVSFSGMRKHQAMWHCVCNCDKHGEKDVSASALMFGSSQSCGCILSEMLKKRNTTHGMTGTREYNNFRNKRRKEIRKILDSEWTYEMEQEIRRMFDKCVVCGSEDGLAIDHVIPLSMKHGLRPGNATVLCLRCNSKKKGRLPNNLPNTMLPDAGEKILKTATEFKKHWESTHSIDAPRARCI